MVKVVPVKSNRQELLLPHSSKGSMEHNHRSQLDLVHGRSNNSYSVHRARVTLHYVKASTKPYVSASKPTVSNIDVHIAGSG